MPAEQPIIMQTSPPGTSVRKVKTCALGRLREWWVLHWLCKVSAPSPGQSMHLPGFILIGFNRKVASTLGEPQIKWSQVYRRDNILPRSYVFFSLNQPDADD